MHTSIRRAVSAPQLTREEEIAIAERIENGRAQMMGIIATTPTLRDSIASTMEISRAEIVDAARQAGEGPDAHRIALLLQHFDAVEHDKEQLVVANMRLVASVARRYAKYGMQFVDLMQEGCIGLMRAAEKFDHRRGFRFATYANWWVRQAIARATTDQSRTIRIPIHINDAIRRVIRKSQDLAHDLGRDPELDELSQALDMPHETVSELLSAIKHTVSLDTPDSSSETNEPPMVEDMHAVSPQSAITDKDLAALARSALADLPPREEKILKLRFGIDEPSEHTLEEIGDSLRVTRERIRQIESRALKRLRHTEKAKRLHTFLD